MLMEDIRIIKTSWISSINKKIVRGVMKIAPLILCHEGKRI